MIKFISIDAIIKDLLFIARGSKVAQSETITWNQIESWIHTYRAVLIKRDLDKGKVPNPDYIQEIPVIKLVKVDYVLDPSVVKSGIDIYRTEIQLPKTIDLNYRSGFTYVGTIEGDEIQFVPQSRVKWQKFRKYVGRNTVAFLRDGYIYVETPHALSYIAVRGVFEVPSDVNTLVNPSETIHEYSSSEAYPIPINWLSTLKEMILKQELNITVTSPSDNTNDGSNKVESNREEQTNQ